MDTPKNVHLNTDYNLDTIAEAVQKAVRTVILIFLPLYVLDNFNDTSYKLYTLVL